MSWADRQARWLRRISPTPPFAAQSPLRKDLGGPHDAPITALILSLGGLGFVRRGPATAGAMLGSAAFWALRPRRRTRRMLILATWTLGQLLIGRVATEEAVDPPFVILDELVGVWAALLFSDLNLGNCMAATVVFRVLDRTKPGPIGVVHRRGGRLSVMGDDLIAGCLAACALRAWQSP